MAQDSDDLFNEFEDDNGEDKAALDDSDIEQAEDVPKALQKVELDLDDAPFLEEEEDDEEEEEPEAPATKSIEQTEEAPKTGILRNPKFLIALAILFVIIVAIPVKIYIFPQKEEVIEEIKAPEPEPAPEPDPEPEPIPEEQGIRMEPFWIERKDSKGVVQFVHLRFALMTTSETAVREIRHKELILRDAIYYYLKNKKYDDLTDTTNVESLKEDLLSVVNKYLTTDQLDTLLVEKFLVK